jgi:hypothetical protein
MFDFNDTWIFRIDFRKILKYQISFFNNCSVWKVGRFSPFGERASKSKELMLGNVGVVLRK